LAVSSKVRDIPICCLFQTACGWSHQHPSDWFLRGKAWFLAGPSQIIRTVESKAQSWTTICDDMVDRTIVPTKSGRILKVPWNSWRDMLFALIFWVVHWSQIWPTTSEIGECPAHRSYRSQTLRSRRSKFGETHAASLEGFISLDCENSSAQFSFFPT
jgi:hypothetical protein